MAGILLFLVSAITHEGEDIQALMAIVHHLGFGIKARGTRATTTSGFSTENLILKSIHTHGPIGTGDGMCVGGITPTR